jgi:DNA-binding response OmpR family regulator
MNMDRNPVLIIDDDETLVDVLSDGLKTHGFDVAVHDCVFGAAALVRELRPAAVLLDLCLPYRAGTALLTELKQDRRTADVPVLIMSGMTESLSEDRRALADGVLSKPFRLETLVDAISSACAGERAS